MPRPWRTLASVNHHTYAMAHTPTFTHHRRTSLRVKRDKLGNVKIVRPCSSSLTPTRRWTFRFSIETVRHGGDENFDKLSSETTCLSTARRDESIPFLPPRFFHPVSSQRTGNAIFHASERVSWLPAIDKRECVFNYFQVYYLIVNFTILYGFHLVQRLKCKINFVNILCTTRMNKQLSTLNQYIIILHFK